MLVQEEQRKKLSRDLHDDISQLLVGIVVNLGNFTKAAERDPSSIIREIPPLRLLVERSVRAVHDFARKLRPAMLDDIGLVAALETYITEFPKAKGRKITFNSEPAADHLDNVRRTALFRIAQESLTNAHKHARSRQITVNLRKADGFVTLEIADDGCAFEVESASAPGGNQLGLIGMRERVEMLGGHLEIASAPGTGTRVLAAVPSGRTRHDP